MQDGDFGVERFLVKFCFVRQFRCVFGVLGNFLLTLDKSCVN